MLDSGICGLRLGTSGRTRVSAERLPGAQVVLALVLALGMGIALVSGQPAGLDGVDFDGSGQVDFGDFIPIYFEAVIEIGRIISTLNTD